MSDKIEQLARDLVNEVIAGLPSKPLPKQALPVVLAVLKPVFKDILELNRLDGRTTLYSARLVLHRAEDDEILEVSPWFHGIPGLQGVWELVEEMSGQLMNNLPAELTAAELAQREPTARVSMSRKLNGVAAIRVPFKTVTGGARLTPGSVGTPQSRVMRIDIGAEAAGRALDKFERDNHSPLCVA